ncbi:hypothetical protein DIURU_002000 [Diutina rugosa]|uniref:Agglutinin-like protein N-terminal domain-containing protein n=1 Tax=Diutina rugosa TaxID=5481 RepID=A0A642UW87_DIURU|nr:uncharacterized protein DIURU_002000 [Diutina rugosa]KAA8904048.1 hypothetical protein DIURU_002000 [Diutina rugosa]
MLVTVPVLAALVSLTSAKEVSGVFTSLDSVKFEPGANYLYDTPNSASWKATVSWKIEGSKYSAGDTFTLNMPGVKRFIMDETEVDLKVGSSTYAKCKPFNGLNIVAFSQLQCTMTDTVTSSTVAYGQASFPVAFCNGGSSGNVDLECAKLWHKGSNTITFEDGKPLTTTANFEAAPYDSRLVYSRSTSVDQPQAANFLRGGVCEQGYRSGTIGMIVNNIDCSNVDFGFSNDLNDWSYPKSETEQFPHQISCSRTQVTVSYQNVPKGYVPYIVVKTSYANSDRVQYINRYQCQNSIFTNRNERVVNWTPYQGSNPNGNGMAEVVTTTTWTGTTTDVTTLPWKSTNGATITVLVKVPDTTSPSPSPTLESTPEPSPSVESATESSASSFKSSFKPTPSSSSEVTSSSLPPSESPSSYTESSSSLTEVSSSVSASLSNSCYLLTSTTTFTPTVTETIPSSTSETETSSSTSETETSTSETSSSTSETETSTSETSSSTSETSSSISETSSSISETSSSISETSSSISETSSSISETETSTSETETSTSETETSTSETETSTSETKTSSSISETETSSSTSETKTSSSISETETSSSTSETETSTSETETSSSTSETYSTDSTTASNTNITGSCVILTETTTYTPSITLTLTTSASRVPPVPQPPIEPPESSSHTTEQSAAEPTTGSSSESEQSAAEPTTEPSSESEQSAAEPTTEPSSDSEQSAAEPTIGPSTESTTESVSKFTPVESSDSNCTAVTSTTKVTPTSIIISASNRSNPSEAIDVNVPSDTSDNEEASTFEEVVSTSIETEIELNKVTETVCVECLSSGNLVGEFSSTLIATSSETLLSVEPTAENIGDNGETPATDNNKNPVESVVTENVHGGNPKTDNSEGQSETSASAELVGQGETASNDIPKAVQTSPTENDVETTTIESHESAWATVVCHGEGCNVNGHSTYPEHISTAPQGQPDRSLPHTEELENPKITLSASPSQLSSHPEPTKLVSPQPFEGAAGTIKISRVAWVLAGALIFV